MKFLQKGRPFIENFLAGKRDEIELLARNPESSTRRYLMGRLLSKISNNPKIERQRTNIVQDANDLYEYGNTKMSRRLFLEQASKRVIDRTILPNVRDEVKDRLQKPIEAAYPLIKQLQDVTDTAPNNVELDKRKRVRKLAAEKPPEAEYAYMGRVATFRGFY